MVAKKSKAKSKAKKAKASKAKVAASTEKLPMINELSFVMMFHGISEDYQELLKEDPVEYMFSVYNMELTMDLKVVENDAKNVHLTLPYYRPTLADK